MKKILSISIVLLALANMSLASAEIGGSVTRSLPTPTYTSAEEFLKAEGATCQQATDGCNTIYIENGAFGAMTEMYCIDAPVIYSCVKQIEQPRICTMEYAPVCGMDGVTYGNSCMAGDTEIAYKHECSSMIDAHFYKRLKNSNSYIAKMQTTLSLVSTSRLQSAMKRADQLIANTNLLKMAQWMQIERITMLTFLKDIIADELASR